MTCSKLMADQAPDLPGHKVSILDHSVLTPTLKILHWQLLWGTIPGNYRSVPGMGPSLVMLLRISHADGLRGEALILQPAWGTSLPLFLLFHAIHDKDPR